MHAYAAIPYELWDIMESRVPVRDWWAFQLWMEQRRRGDDTRQTETICRWLRMQRDVAEYINPEAFEVSAPPERVSA